MTGNASPYNLADPFRPPEIVPPWVFSHHCNGRNTYIYEYARAGIMSMICFTPDGGVYICDNAQALELHVGLLDLPWIRKLYPYYKFSEAKLKEFNSQHVSGRERLEPP